MDKNKKIVIVGGGIAGLTTALSLEYFGLNNYIVVERAKEFKEIGAAISVWPNALHVYREIGIYESLAKKWGAIESAYIKTSEGDILAKSTPNYELPLVCMHRADLHSILYNQLPQNKLKANHQLKNIIEKEGYSLLEFENGNTLQADIVIGADGINSKVRKHILNDGKPIFRGYNIWRGIAKLDDLDLGYGSETWGKGKRVGIVPIGKGSFGWWVTANEDENQSDEPDGTLTKLKDLFGEWHQPIPRLFENSPTIMKNKIGDREPNKNWFKNNMVLVGDAAHPTTPNLGQGACMAIEGSYILSKCLHLFDVTTAFEKYRELHYKRSTDVTKQSLQNGKMGQLENSIAIKARNGLIKSMPDKLAVKMLDKFFGYNVTKINI